MIQFKDLPIVEARINRFSPLPAHMPWSLTATADAEGVRLTLGHSRGSDLLSDSYRVIVLPWSADLSCDGLYAAVKDAAI